jgi:pimeloyl-ACP methyl ester carboxylesterase
MSDASILMPIPTSSRATTLLLLLAACQITAGVRAAPSNWQERHDQLVARLRALTKTEDAFGPAYRPLYHSALPWYERWGGRVQHAVDDWMVPPDDYAAELADALEHGRNYFAENPEALLPLVFETRLSNGTTVNANYWVILPTGFPERGRKFPLVISLHGTGWWGHSISCVHRARQSVAVRRAFGVTPINEGGPWQIDFLNAYLDQLLEMLPIDQDHVYVEGHSLGAMATWEWAMNNPERFAAISPRSGIGEPFRAMRLKNVPAWVIHGANDPVIPSGCSDQMVRSLQASGASVRYSVLKGVEHNMPPDLDEEQILDWYLQQTRSHQPLPADPRDTLGLTPAGFSPWEIMAAPGGRSWSSDPQEAKDDAAGLRAVHALFKKLHDFGELADSPVQLERDLKNHTVRYWLAIPRTLQPDPRMASSAIEVPAAKYLRFYFRGETEKALAHLATVVAEAEAAGHRLRSESVWITPLSLRPGTATHIAEYRIQIE